MTASSSSPTRKSAHTSAASARAQPSAGPAASKITTQDASEDESVSTTSQVTTGLYVVSTPIGNLGDMSERAISTLRGVQVIACEDTRVTSVLLRRFGIATPMTPYHDHNAERARPALIKRMQAGEAVALVSDAGTPLLSDPGFKLVQECAQVGLAVVPIPGASALLAALVTAALPTDRVMFAGFLPSKQSARRTELTDLKPLRATLVFYESTQRLADTLADMALILGARPAAVCRELTKRHEEVRRDRLDVLAAHYAKSDTPKGEIVLVIGGASDEDKVVSEADIDVALRQALSTHSVRDAAVMVASELGQPKRLVYARAVALARDSE